MQKPIFILIAVVVSSISASVHADENGLSPYRFVEVKRTKTEAGLPPRLQVVFDKKCNEEFIKVLRAEETEIKTMKVTITVGVLVKLEPLKTCSTPAREMTVHAGDLFSGRDYKVAVIRK